MSIGSSYSGSFDLTDVIEVLSSSKAKLSAWDKLSSLAKLMASVSNSVFARCDSMRSFEFLLDFMETFDLGGMRGVSSISDFLMPMS